LEWKALHDSILHYSVYLKYIPRFEVFSDHNALRYMVNSDNSTTNGRLIRYLLALQEYNFAIYYRKGTENCDADAVSRLKRCSDKPVYLTADELGQENRLERARALDRRNEKLQKTAKKLLNKLAKQELRDMATLNDHILSEGVENLESESGRARFLENLKARGLKCSETALDDLLRVRREDAGESEAVDASDAAEEEPMPMIAAMVNLLGANRGYRNTPEEAERQPLCMRGSLSSRAEDGIQEEEPLPARSTHSTMCGMCQIEDEAGDSCKVISTNKQ
jgi:hypothetical protein